MRDASWSIIAEFVFASLKHGSLWKIVCENADNPCFLGCNLSAFMRISSFFCNHAIMWGSPPQCWLRLGAWEGVPCLHPCGKKEIWCGWVLLSFSLSFFFLSLFLFSLFLSFLFLLLSFFLLSFFLSLIHSFFLLKSCHYLARLTTTKWFLECGNECNWLYSKNRSFKREASEGKRFNFHLCHPWDEIIIRLVWKRACPFWKYWLVHVHSMSNM